jgi:uncharacterized protein YbcI
MPGAWYFRNTRDCEGESRMSDSTCNGAGAAPRRKGELEAAISRAFIQLEKECTGRGPVETHTFLLDDMIVVRLRGVLTPAEQKLSQVEQRGPYLIKQARAELTNVKRDRLETLVQDLLGVGIRSLHTDISTRTGEGVVVLSLNGRPALPVD